MQALDEQSTQTMNKMVSMMVEDNVKIDNSNAVSVEMLYENDHYKIYSVAQFNEQNRNLMSTEMWFIYLNSMELYYPCYLKQESLGLEESSIITIEGKIFGCRVEMQAEHAEFANTWLTNFKQ